MTNEVTDAEEREMSLIFDKWFASLNKVPNTFQTFAAGYAAARMRYLPAEPDGDHDIPTDGQLLDQLQDAFYKCDSGHVEQDIQLRKDLVNVLVRYNAENRD